MNKSFEDLIVWQKARDLAILIYKNFSDCRDFSFRDQIQRATISISNNIAEGYERSTNKEFRQFLYIAKGSAAEVRSILNIALELKMINQVKQEEVINTTIEISKMLSKFIQTLTKS